MRYKPPKFNNKDQWVPIVAKDKDWLIGYISGIQMIEELVIETLEDNGVKLDLRGIDLCLDSSRFNDVLENGKRESECTDSEIKKYYNKLIEDKITMVKEKHPDNDANVFSDCFLITECVCGLGVNSFKNPKEIPDKQFKCQICGRVVIDYTYQNDAEFDFDGDSLLKYDRISDELQKRLDDELDKIEDDDEEKLF